MFVSIKLRVTLFTDWVVVYSWLSKYPWLCLGSYSFFQEVYAQDVPAHYYATLTQGFLPSLAYIKPLVEFSRRIYHPAGQRVTGKPYLMCPWRMTLQVSHTEVPDITPWSTGTPDFSSLLFLPPPTRTVWFVTHVINFSLQACSLFISSFIPLFSFFFLFLSFFPSFLLVARLTCTHKH